MPQCCKETATISSPCLGFMALAHTNLYVNLILRKQLHLKKKNLITSTKVLPDSKFEKTVVIDNFDEKSFSFKICKKL